MNAYGAFAELAGVVDLVDRIQWIDCDRRFSPQVELFDWLDATGAERYVLKRVR
jgi:hypothetical protein